MTTDNEQPKSAEEIRPKELAKEIFDLTEELRIKAKILRLEKEDDLIDYWEKRIESSAQQRIKELEEQLESARSSDDNYEEEEDFIPCSECDGHDACADFGCAIKAGLGHMLHKPL